MSGPAVIAKITAQPGKRAELIAALQTLVDHTATEPGTLEYTLHLEAGNDDVVWFYERYDSKESFDAHGTSDTIKTVGAGLRDVAAGRPEVIMLDVVSGKGL